MVPRASRWQETTDGHLMRIVYRPVKWKKPSESVPVCSGCGTPFRDKREKLGELVLFEADCLPKHITNS